jgi:hypothetical protein
MPDWRWAWWHIREGKKKRPEGRFFSSEVAYYFADTPKERTVARLKYWSTGRPLARE